MVYCSRGQHVIHVFRFGSAWCALRGKSINAPDGEAEFDSTVCEAVRELIGGIR